ncbi:PIR Superfamily Protein [Plasmodium ovale wallikeri]|uniref:PIR Superfamily Protein n=2 Tax=Plasmodium ovale TaxID=36330 RepID=A0A1A8YHC4_PLAOA|nr:PIR Superfamily Protein [Plasmodium ovale wallikeri]SBT31534.1 PIR Superfamily Protein [Plasmodium ovale wallikeri]SBT74242.1 hypothetical protein POWCR01_000196300 [Plasmodium ovale]
MHEGIFSRVKNLYSFHGIFNKFPSDPNAPTKNNCTYASECLRIYKKYKSSYNGKIINNQDCCNELIGYIEAYNDNVSLKDICPQEQRALSTFTLPQEDSYIGSS